MPHERRLNFCQQWCPKVLDAIGSTAKLKAKEVELRVLAQNLDSGAPLAS